MFISVGIFPQVVRQALREMKYTKDDIDVSFGNGVRDAYINRMDTARFPRTEFVTTVELKTGAIVISTAPEPCRVKLDSKFVVVENDAHKHYFAKPNTIVMHGSTANKGKLNTELKMFIHPVNMVLSAVKDFAELSERDRILLYIFGIMPKGGSAYKESLARLNVTDAEVNVLVERGLLEKTSKGYAITTMSKNLRQPSSLDHLW